MRKLKAIWLQWKGMVDMYKIMQTLLMEEMKDYVAHPKT